MILQGENPAIMSYKNNTICRKCSLVAIIMLLFQVCEAQYKFEKVERWLTDNLKDLGGRAVLVIYKDGKLIYNHAENDLTGMQKFIGKRMAAKQGKDSDEALQDFNSDSKILIASCSKWLSAALVMTFVDEDKLKVDDTVGKYLPVMTANGKGNITLEQCLSHRTGIQSSSLMEELKTITNAATMDEAIAHIASKPMEGEPGKTFHYSSDGLQIAAAVIEKISGKNFKTLFKERIADPCNMPHTDFGDKNVPLPAGGAKSTAEDYIHFLTMIVSNGLYNNTRVLSEQSVAAMQVNRVGKDCAVAHSPSEAGGLGYGFGEWVLPACDSLSKKIWGCTEAGSRSSFASSPGLFGSFPWINNEKGYAGFLLTLGLKSQGRSERYRKLRELVEEALQP